VKESKDEVTALLAAIDAEAPERDGFGSLLLDIAQLLAALAEAVAGRQTNAQRILKRPTLSTRESVQAMRDGVEDLCRSAKSSSYALHDLSFVISRMQEHGIGGFGRLLIWAKQILERGQQEEGVAVRLTETEARILHLLASGLTPKAIAGETGRSVLTVQTHIQNLTEKLGCHGRAEAIAAARRLGLLA